MVENNTEFRERVRNSFSNVKLHMNKLENDIKELKKFILQRNNEIIDLKEQIKAFKPADIDFKDVLEAKKNGSIGNEGVYANMHAHMQTSVHIPKHILDTLSFRQDLEGFFLKLTKQEFLVFLTIYQLDEEKKPVSYILLSKYLNLSTGCIRTHLTNLLRKNAPITKTKINNKLTLLGISKDFKDLGLKQKLVNLYYRADPSQTTLN